MGNRETPQEFKDNNIKLIRIPFYNHKWSAQDYRDDILNNWIDNIKNINK